MKKRFLFLLLLAAACSMVMVGCDKEDKEDELAIAEMAGKYADGVTIMKVGEVVATSADLKAELEKQLSEMNGQKEESPFTIATSGRDVTLDLDGQKFKFKDVKVAANGVVMNFGDVAFSEVLDEDDEGKLTLTVKNGEQLYRIEGESAKYSAAYDKNTKTFVGYLLAEIKYESKQVAGQSATVKVNMEINGTKK